MKGVILQPNFIPWRGYFDLIKKADVFIFLDDVQYTHRDWRNRNQIKTHAGPQWLTVPVNHIERSQLICNVDIDYSTNWQSKHMKALITSYSKAPFFGKFESLLDIIYINKSKKIADLSIDSIKWISNYLEFKPQFYRSSDGGFQGHKQNKILDICSYYGITHYISGPSAKNYISLQEFKEKGIEVEFQQYNYADYEQINGPFLANVTILDLLFNCGPDSKKYIQNTE